MHRVAVLVLDQVVAFDLAVPCQVFGAAQLSNDQPAYETRVCGSRSVAVTTGAQTQFRLAPLWPLEAIVQADTIVVPGLQNLDYVPSRRVVGLLNNAAGRGVRIASVCTGAFVLAAAGLLDGRRATTHWQSTEELARRYPSIEVDQNVLYVDNDGRVLTSAGLAAGLDMCLHMVQSDHGAAVAAATARLTVVPLVRQGGQSQFIGYDQPTNNNGGLQLTLEWMQANLQVPLTLQDIASHASMSTRSLTRHFQQQVGTTPLQHLLRLRVQRAQELLETTDLPIERIHDKVGFRSSIAFRQQFTHRVGIPPQRFRNAFQARRTASAAV
jgi:transcriptional regulator GlxA family with amidase domain